MVPRRAPRPDDPPARLERQRAWAGLRAGDEVAIAGRRRRGATWHFVAHVRNPANGEEWVEVVEDAAQRRLLRSFRPEQVFPPGTAPGSGASLAEAPRLPLG